MGKSKIKIEKKEFKAERQRSFHVRHLGVLKKAYELSVLCDVDVGLVYYSPTGDLRHFSTKSANVAKMLQGLVGYLENASEEEKTRLRLSQDTINMINITAAQDDAAVQADQDAVRREVIKNKIRDLKLLQETKRYKKKNKISHAISLSVLIFDT
ncbi:hypothetical protein LUZ61_000857 [Rhynchospora tenuis]|uniref:MADS-box domain-containing protein n=1 Tax=Rhynchospora tenuis TaxID=198213 RepID=A0AAD6EQ88_9POAL|nr:hypothetical protein LUZ61_000857 [Rhynchospora tenuis]